MKNNNKKLMRKNLKLAIVKEFGSQARFAYESEIDEALISKLINTVRDPSPEQSAIIVKLLKRSAKYLFRKSYFTI